MRIPGRPADGCRGPTDDADRVAGAGRHPAVRRLLSQGRDPGRRRSAAGSYSSSDAVGIVVAFMTAFYTFRMVFMTFAGSWRGPQEAWKHVHESASTMVVPLIILAVPTALVGLLLGVRRRAAGPPRARESVFSPPRGTCVGSSRLPRRHGAQRLRALRHRWAAAARRRHRRPAGNRARLGSGMSPSCGPRPLRGADPVGLRSEDCTPPA